MDVLPSWPDWGPGVATPPATNRPRHSWASGQAYADLREQTQWRKAYFGIGHQPQDCFPPRCIIQITRGVCPTQIAQEVRRPGAVPPTCSRLPGSCVPARPAWPRPTASGRRIACASMTLQSLHWPIKQTMASFKLVLNQHNLIGFTRHDLTLLRLLHVGVINCPLWRLARRLASKGPLNKHLLRRAATKSAAIRLLCNTGTNFFGHGLVYNSIGRVRH